MSLVPKVKKYGEIFQALNNLRCYDEKSVQDQCLQEQPCLSRHKVSPGLNPYGSVFQTFRVRGNLTNEDIWWQP